MVKGARPPIEGRLRKVMVELNEAWEDTATKPTWKIDQENPPQKWNVKMLIDDDERPK